MKRFLLTALVMIPLITVSACAEKRKGYDADTYNLKPGHQLEGKSGWYKNAVVYHVWVKSFNDAKYSDGIGDLKGITKKMGYLQDLGISVIWLSPIFECQKKNSTMHGYDVTDFYAVNDRFGTKEDLEDLLEAAHAKGIRVIFDFPLNHTSSKHTWLDAKPEWYVWSKEVKEGWGFPWGGGNPYNVWRFHKSGQHFYSAFATDELADLNYLYKDSAGHYPVRDEIYAVSRYWLDRGFDGMRVDAARYIAETGAGHQADTSETHDVLRELRSVLNEYDGKTKSPKVMIAEAWTDETRVGPYYGDGTNEFHSCLDFMHAQRIPSAIEQEEPAIITALWDYEAENYPAGYISAQFQSNHDNLVSRPATVFEGDAKKQILSAAVTVFGPGMPVIYYGNEIGMEGESGNDANLRTKIDWDEVDKQDDAEDSILNWYRYIIRTRNSCPSLSGTNHVLKTSNESVLAMEKEQGDEKTLVLLNFSSEPKDITVDLSSANVKPDAPVYSVLGNLPKRSTLHGAILDIKALPGYGINVIYLEGRKKPKAVHGYMK